MSVFPFADVGDDAAEAVQRQADSFRQKPLSAEEQEHVKRVDRIIMNVLSQVPQPSVTSIVSLPPVPGHVSF